MSGKATKANTGSTPPETSTAAEVISSNVDLLTEILLRLPAKSLIRFKCVSKHWLSLISHPQFATNHSLRNPSPAISGLYFYRLNSVSLHGNQNLPSLSFLDGLEGKHFPTTIQRSCNGLLLLLQTGCLDLRDSRLPLFIVCNPTTRKYTILPKTSLLSRLRGGRGAYLAFDPSKSTHYKVVVAGLCDTEIVVYDSESGNWKNISRPGVFLVSWCVLEWSNPLAVFWNGAIHWLRMDNRRDNILWKYDTDAEEIIALPPSTRLTTISYHFSYFGECGGCLILILVQSPLRALSYPTEFQILELESENSGWIVKYQVNLRTIISALGGTEERNEYFVLGVVKGAKKEDYVLVLAILGKVISYNLKSKTIDVLRDLVPGEQNNGIGYPFVETLSHF